MSEQINLLPCPFCGSTEIFAEEEPSVNATGEMFGVVKCCGCGARFVCKGAKQEYVKVEGDMYRLIPARSGFEIAVEKWNTRAKANS